ncbi:MAG: hypothetical protein AMJ90_08125 [candidate division Zixibacteria bacterium SM23_73_2]|nr:MAG: hypothetical protein AMJ90_08125 [candidate division Zixibacteria bacterium SM23_73_2]
MFSVKLEDINIERIKDFYNQKVPEGETIEYKKDIPENKKIAKTISAMANTYGGILLIGIEADKKRNIPVAITGITLEEGLEERITGICLRSIYRPVFPEVKLCDFIDEKGNEKTVLFIRIQESDSTPHAINNNTDVYIRIRSQSEKFERKATVDEIDWLKNRREKAVEFRQQLINRARDRYQSKTASLRYLQNCFREVSLIPLFPHNMLFSCDEFFRVLDKIKNEAEQNGFKRCVDNIIDLSKTAAGSLYIFEMRKGEKGAPYSMYYQEYNIFGLVYRKNSFWELSRSETKDSFDVKSFLQDLYYVLNFGLLFYKSVGYHGIIKISVHVKGLLGKTISWIQDENDNRIYSHVWGKNEMDNSYDFEKYLLMSELEDGLYKLLLLIYKELLWTGGVVKYLEEKIQSMKAEINIVKDYYSN